MREAGIFAMMPGTLKTVLLFLDGRRRNDAKALENELAENEILCEWHEAGSSEKISQLKCAVADYGDACTLLVTDDRALAKFAASFGLVCVGCEETEGSLTGFSFFEGAVLVAERLADLDVQLLRETFLHAKGFPVTVVRTERLVLREMIPDDFAALRAISRQAGSGYLMMNGQRADEFFSDENLRGYIAYVYRWYGYGLWSVLLHDGTLIGCCGLQDSESVYEAGAQQSEARQNAAKGDCLDLQYMVNEAYRCRGFGAEMCRGALGYAFARTQARHIRILCHPDNAASRALAKKLGFRRTGEEAGLCCYLRDTVL